MCVCVWCERYIVNEPESLSLTSAWFCYVFVFCVILRTICRVCARSRARLCCRLPVSAVLLLTNYVSLESILKIKFAVQFAKWNPFLQNNQMWNSCRKRHDVYWLLPARARVCNILMRSLLCNFVLTMPWKALHGVFIHWSNSYCREFSSSANLKNKILKTIGNNKCARFMFNNWFRRRSTNVRCST